MDNEQLGQRIANARVTKGYTPDQFARRIGVRTSTVESWEKGRSAPRANRLNTIAGILSVPVVWLISGADEFVE